MGLWREKVQSISMGFFILLRADDKGASVHQEKEIRTKKKREREKNGKVSIKKHSVPCLGLGGLHHKKRIEELLSVNHLEKYRKRQYMEQVCI
jgi:hypothetical protein